MDMNKLGKMLKELSIANVIAFAMMVISKVTTSDYIHSWSELNCYLAIFAAFAITVYYVGMKEFQDLCEFVKDKFEELKYRRNAGLKKGDEES